jgi:hypothetical protein
VQPLGGAAQAAFLKHGQKQTKLFEHPLRVMRIAHHRNLQSALSADGLSAL